MADGFLSPNDLDIFTQRVMQQDPFAQMGASVQQMPLNMSTWSPTAQGVGSFAKSFLGTLLGNYAQQNAAQQTRAAIGAFPALMADPLNAAAPEGVDPAAFDTLRSKAALANEARNASIKQSLAQRGVFLGQPELSDQVATVLGKQQLEQSKAQELGRLAAYGYGVEQPSTKDGEAKPKITLDQIPGTPQFENKKSISKSIREEEDSARKELTATPSISQIRSYEKSLPLVASFKDGPTKSSDLPFVINYVKAMDDNAVKEGEIALAETANPLLQKWAGQINMVAEGKSTLTPELKNQMYQELLASKGILFNQAKSDIERRFKIAQSRGVTDINNISPISLENIEVPSVRTLPTNQSIPAGMKLQVNKKTGETRLVPQ